jgi:hypothetical protein
MSKEQPCQFDCELKQKCECCFFNNGAQEQLSTGLWYRQSKIIDDERHGWFRFRESFQPIVGNKENTMIAGVIYTHSEGTLKMTVLFPPLHPAESRLGKVYLTGVSSGSTWEKPCNINEGSWHCLVRFDSIPHSEAYTYEVQYAADPSGASNAFYVYGGNVPIQKDYPRIAAASCFGKDSTKDKDEFRDAVLAQEPDLLILQGDQTYFHSDVSDAIY